MGRIIISFKDCCNIKHSLIFKAGLLSASHLEKSASSRFAQKRIIKKESLLERGSFFSSTKFIQLLAVVLFPTHFYHKFLQMDNR
jgi:hypothetical protein